MRSPPMAIGAWLSSSQKHLPDKNRREALSIARGIVSTMVGAVTLADIACDSTTANAILDNAQVFIEGVLSD